MIYQPGTTILGMHNREQVLGVECPSCRHRTVFSARQLIEHSDVGEMAGLDYMARRMRCCLCGTKGASFKQLPEAKAELWLGDAER